MGGRRIDDLARSLARPMPRRGMFKAAAAGVMTLYLGRPLAAASSSTAFRGGADRIIRSPATEDCFEFSCPAGSICCSNSDPPGNCPDYPHCCDPCDPNQNMCKPDGGCGPGGRVPDANTDCLGYEDECWRRREEQLKKLFDA